MIELLVAVAVLSVLVVMLFGLVDSATKLWRDNENRVDAFREARAALAVITSDLNSLSASANTNFLSLTAVGAAAPDADAQGLYFLTLLPPTAQPSGNKSDLCAVGYFRRWTFQNDGFGQTNASDPTRKGFHLFRSLYGSDLTYSNLLAGAPPLRDLQQPTASVAVAPEILARNILGLEFVCYAATTNYTNASSQAYVPWTYATNNPLPQMIEVRLTAISDEAAKKLGGDRSRWSTNDALVEKEARTFVSRIRLRPPSSAN